MNSTVEELSEDRIRQINWEMAEAIVDYMRSALKNFGVPESTFADDQFDNFVAMYNRRGDMVTILSQENDILRRRIASMEDMLVSIANWPNPSNHDQTKAMKVWAASVVDPARVNMLKSLTDG